MIFFSGNHTSKIRNRNGFTLIELLVVVAIIAVLIAILLPALQTARESARKVICMTNLSQINMAMEYYRTDYTKGPPGWCNGSWPGGVMGGPAAFPANEGWYSYQPWGIGPYLKKSGTFSVADMGKTDSVLYCPTYFSIGNTYAHGTGYALNIMMGYHKFLGEKVELPNSTPMLLCAPNNSNINNNQILAFSRNISGWELCQFPLVLLAQGWFPHKGSANFLFFDGHVINQPSLSSATEYDKRWTWYGK
ncbi:MAG: DUF1559 domain-containing protein [Phycisphaerae bacterium]